MNQKNNINIFTPVLIGGSLILLISFAIRSTFGLFQIPIADEFMWARSEFSMAIAIQNLAWGIGTPIFSAFAEKFGDRKAITLGLADGIGSIDDVLKKICEDPELDTIKPIGFKLVINKIINNDGNYSMLPNEC